MIKVQEKDGNRGIFATSLTSRGTVLFKDSAIAVVSKTHCQWCLSKAAKRCGKCKLYYCSTRCQKNDWACHSRTCGMQDEELEMLVKVCHYLQTDPQDHVEIMDTSKKELFKSLVSHADKISKDEYNEIRLKAEYSRITSHSIAQQIEFISKFRRNNFGIYDYNLFDIAKGAFCIGSLLNHSCVPNAIMIFNNREMNVLALRDIKENEQIFISYIDPIHDYANRCVLLSKYYFTCTCEKCSLKLYQQVEIKQDTNKFLVDGLLIIKEYKNHRQVLDKASDFYADLDSYKNTSSLLSQCLDDGDFATCAHLAVIKIATLIMQYPPHHPLIGLECLLGAKICWNSNQDALGLLFLDIANETLSIFKEFNENKELNQLNKLYNK
ncbi:hypothetical protein HDV01_007652 [Terramyces sp. JEL0728]|nr:hypothetical protein HDV01_007652 [Terramyces sp. JEL0728]